MFRCGRCNCQVGLRQPVNRVVVEERSAFYPERPRATSIPGKERKEWKTDPGGTGMQIVREISACPECYKVLTGKEPRIRVIEDKQEDKPKPKKYKQKSKQNHPEIEVVSRLPL